jgi:hypothetical protein
MSHNLNDPWTRLTSAARGVSDGRDTSPPPGFATRIAALALAQERRVHSLLDRFALHALGVASLLAMCSVALNYQAISGPGAPVVVQVEEPELVAADDAVAIVLDLALAD